MPLFRILFLSGALITTAGGAYLGWQGIGGESVGLHRSVRLGSPGNLGSSAVK